MEGLRDKLSSSQEESRMLDNKLASMDSRIKELDNVNKELTAQIARKEETIHQLNVSKF